MIWLVRQCLRFLSEGGRSVLIFPNSGWLFSLHFPRWTLVLFSHALAKVLFPALSAVTFTVSSSQFWLWSARHFTCSSFANNARQTFLRLRFWLACFLSRLAPSSASRAGVLTDLFASRPAVNRIKVSIWIWTPSTMLFSFDKRRGRVRRSIQNIVLIPKVIPLKLYLPSYSLCFQWSVTV